MHCYAGTATEAGDSIFKKNQGIVSGGSNNLGWLFFRKSA
jgi:hypothetical protein